MKLFTGGNRWFSTDSYMGFRFFKGGPSKQGGFAALFGWTRVDERINEISKMYADPAAGFFPSRYGMQDHFGAGRGTLGPQSRSGGCKG